MREYLEKVIYDFAEDIVSKTASPSRKGMFTVDEISEILGKTKPDRLRSITEKLLYISNRERLDINLAIFFLCTRVTKKTIQDWVKLKRVI